MDSFAAIRLPGLSASTEKEQNRETRSKRLITTEDLSDEISNFRGM